MIYIALWLGACVIMIFGFIAGARLSYASAYTDGYQDGMNYEKTKYDQSYNLSALN